MIFILIIKYKICLTNIIKIIKMCDCIEIREVPSIFCLICGEIQCIVCLDFKKCESCSSFCCENCIISLLCNHNYCSVRCILKNEKEVCKNYCFFLRDVDATGTDEQGLNNLLIYWCTKVDKSQVKIWINSYLNNPDNNDSDVIIKKIKQLDIYIKSL